MLAKKTNLLRILYALAFANEVRPYFVEQSTKKEEPAIKKNIYGKCGALLIPSSSKQLPALTKYQGLPNKVKLCIASPAGRPYLTKSLACRQAQKS
jgi:hypothetical protein